MGNSFRKKPRDYCIFCIIDEFYRNVFVGKSYSQNPRSHYYAHLRGEHELTEEEFTDELAEPQFVVLEYIKCTGSMAFRHVVAWYRFFEENGFCVMVGENIGRMIDNFSPITAELYETICAPLTLSEVLTRTVPKLEEPKDKKSYCPMDNKSAKNIQLNIRVKEDVKEAFKKFCKEMEISQSDALRLLLLGEEFKGREVIMRELLLEQEQTRLQADKYRHLYEELLKKQNQEICLATQRKKEWTKIARDFLSFIVDYSIPSDHKKAGIHPFSSRYWRSIFRDAEYPTESGVASIFLVGLVYGRSNETENKRMDAPLFIIGRTEDGKLLKFRWYPRKGYVGKSPQNDEHAYEGAKWLVGFIITKDKAAELVASIPFNRIPKHQDCDVDWYLELERDVELNMEGDWGEDAAFYSLMEFEETTNSIETSSFINNSEAETRDRKNKTLDDMIHDASIRTAK